MLVASSEPRTPRSHRQHRHRLLSGVSSVMTRQDKSGRVITLNKKATAVKLLYFRPDTNMLSFDLNSIYPMKQAPKLISIRLPQ